ncbi:hypothetical protein ALX04_009415 [Lactiplantibacillus plantarum subsp. plantarum]|uniref:DUF4352 domain-containing protein n=1 Tax=Lactiplantibacillus plantarum TaxID=1590 RepID=UPI00048981FE|nr:DUF4352 domain-containing protein [Lactiplantibacillus plantarum]MCS6092136.1 DUF4352 domain-containing protein [Lactobacillus sp. LMY-20]UZM82477.1 DUF4352 domain-containing protein [Lactiplantibacillus argentoratensis]AOG33078.1 hypothetical protein AWV72_02307 [Lactiplantibacillus plantarum]AQX94717.1 DUF4352 domain-containing protein [Lactiplantibacillus plantarum]ASI63867.1 hypothetical protein ALX04_009415 [Lactiplantibacillus plantarum subsp. plantarum]
MQKTKAWYQKWWAWVLILLGIFFVISLVNSPQDGKNSQAATTKKTSASKSTAKEPPANTIYKVGQTATIDHVQVTVNNVKTATTLNDVQPKTGNQYYTVTVTLKNSGRDKVSYNPFDFKIKAAGNQTSLDEINIDENNQLDSGDLTAGGSVSGTMTGQAKADGSVELIYNPSYFSDRHLTFKLQ